MDVTEAFAQDLLAPDEYLLDPPESVWEGILNMDHATWCEISDMEVVRRAEEHTREHGKDITREAWLGLYSPANPLKAAAPASLAATHAIFRRAESMEAWKALRQSVSADEVAAAFGAGYFARDLISQLPPEVKEKLREAQQAQDELARLESQIKALEQMADAIEASQPGAGQGRGAQGRAQSASGQLKRRGEQLRAGLDAARARAQQTAGHVGAALDQASARTEQALARSIAGASAGLGC